jgi:rod shape-determining protein MreC
VFPFTSEVTLLTDKNQAIPVQVVRNGLRSVAYGRGQSNVLDLRFMPTNADIQKGDVLVTSGIDGVYPAGLAVATVSLVENKSADSFARIVCQPSAGLDRNRQLLILLTANKAEPRAPDDTKDKNAKMTGILRHAASRTNGTSGKGIVETPPVPSSSQPATSTR